MAFKVFGNLFGKKETPLEILQRESQNPINALHYGSRFQTDCLESSVFGTTFQKGTTYTVIGFSKMQLGNSTWYSYYLNGFGQVSVGKSVLQLVIDRNNQVESCRIFDIHEFFPGNAGWWDDWAGNEGVIGQLKVNLPDIQKNFERAAEWVEGDDPWVIPAVFEEDIFSEQMNYFARSTAMLYGRYASEDPVVPEYLILAAVELTDANRQTSRVIYQMFGIDLSTADIINIIG